MFGDVATDGLLGNIGQTTEPCLSAVLKTQLSNKTLITLFHQWFVLTQLFHNFA